MEYPVWLSIVLGLAMAVALAGLGGWLLFTSLTKAINAALKLESKRTNRETEALDCWKTAYDAEHEDHVNDVTELTDTIFTLKKEIEIKNRLLAKVKVKDL